MLYTPCTLGLQFLALVNIIYYSYCLSKKKKKKKIQTNKEEERIAWLDVYMTSLQNSPYSTRLTQNKNTDNWINGRKTVRCWSINATWVLTDTNDAPCYKIWWWVMPIIIDIYPSLKVKSLLGVRMGSFLDNPWRA